MLKLIVFFILLSVHSSLLKKYQPNWESLDTRPLPTWYDKAKIGIFIHWGVFSVPSFGNEWFWYRWKTDQLPEYVNYMKKKYKPNFTYQDFAKDFTAELFDPAEWARIFKNSGAKYVVLTSKHHEGYTMWPSNYSYSWNSKAIGPNRDLVGDLSKAIKAANLTFGLYHSLKEWYNPLYMADLASNWSTKDFARTKNMPELLELVEKYEPWLIDSDGTQGGPQDYWNSTGFLAWLNNDSPVKKHVVVNDRWDNTTHCHHGDVFWCHDRYNPGVLQKHKWENAMTLDKLSWGFRREAKLDDYLTISELLFEVVSTVSCGGNILINVGPTKDGTIAPIFQDRLSNLGEWLGINGAAIYESKPWIAQNDSVTHDVWYTQKDGAVYAIALSWPENNSLKLGSVKNVFKNETVVTLVGNEHYGRLKTTVGDHFVNIEFLDMAKVKSRWAYVLRIKNLSETDL